MPVHLLTAEAFSIYRKGLATRGLIAIDIPNKYLRLGPILAAAAARLGLEAITRTDVPDENRPLAYSSVWVAIARSPDVVAPLLAQPGWSRLENDGTPPWTDDHSDLMRPLLAYLLKHHPGP